MAMNQFTVETAFADARIARGASPLRDIHIKGPGRFLAAFRDTPENRDRAKLLIAAPDMLEALKAQAEASEFAASLSAITADGDTPPKSVMDKCDQLFSRAERLRNAAIAKAEGK